MAKKIRMLTAKKKRMASRMKSMTTAMKSPQQFLHPLLVRAKTNMVAAAKALRLAA